MKNAIFLSCAALLINSAAFSQTCNMALKDGAKLTVNITTYTNPEKKEEKIAAFNADVLAGKIKPASNADMLFAIKKTTLKNADLTNADLDIIRTEIQNYIVYIQNRYPE